MYNHSIKSARDKLATAQALPQNTSAYGDEGSLEFSGTQGALEIVVACNTAITIAAAKKLEIELYDSADDSAFAAVDGCKVVITDSSETTYAAGDEICRINPPSTLRQYAKIRFLTDDAAASGAVDAWLDYLAR